MSQSPHISNTPCHWQGPGAADTHVVHIPGHPMSVIVVQLGRRYTRVPCGPHGYRTSCQAAACACQWAVVLPVLARVPLCHQANPMTAWLLEQGLPWDGTRQKPAARPRFQGPWRPVPGPRTRARWRMALQRRGPRLGQVDLALGSAGGCPGGQQ